MRKKPIQIIVFSLIFGGLLNLLTRIPALRTHRITLLIILFIILIFSILATYSIFDKYLNKFFKK